MLTANVPGLTFEAEAHKYAIDRAPAPSVTGILQRIGAVSFEGVPPEILAVARDRGRAVHAATHYDDEGDLEVGYLDRNQAIEPYVWAWRKAKRELGFVPELLETPVCSRVHWYAGTLDRVGRLRNVHGLSCRALVDIKAVRRIQKATALQTQAYADALRESTGIEVDVRFAVQLNPDGSYRIEEYGPDRVVDDAAGWLGALLWARWVENNYARRSVAPAVGVL